ncbi:hypothetical protein CAPTEDRAFT_208987 [Capitella teleta]|uniref:L-asparaginase N-terminal domain-containing protein n=1 Tax=Capitella teleta TaxID=283909 RepID=R7U5Y2_CAPTE|nr:hypothetical protein CAPTEDRAFT_208987 [Capitella teleta]|eukprot:ELT98565.1 hypothetical protein CAPTEDRAFT_208987 [Capitella teleta]
MGGCLSFVRSRTKQGENATFDSNQDGSRSALMSPGTISPSSPSSSEGGSEIEGKVLVLYSGGTIGMKTDKNGDLSPEPNVLDEALRKLTTFHDPSYAARAWNEKSEPLVLPCQKGGKRVVYKIVEYDPLLDSSNMKYDDYAKIDQNIRDNYSRFDAFVVLHGTDTMAFTASALSFMLGKHLGKPVIVTGSQIPIYEVRSDGRDNFLGALTLAGNYSIPEVRAVLRPPMKGVVLQTYGTGNGPTAHKDFMAALKDASENTMIVNCTHCPRGAVTALYSVGKELQDIEVIQGSDMTVEAALMKLSYVLGRNDFTAEQKREMMGKDLCGEMTPYPNLYNAGCLDEGEIYNRHNLVKPLRKEGV